MELQPGVVLAGKLRLERILGQGGMGVVWAARHLTLDTDVAVKVVRPERVAADPWLLARFEREARATARIAHPHVVKVMDYGTVDAAVPFLVMELLRGFSLGDLLESGGRFSLATATSLVEQVGSALESAHGHGVVHRDIKPHNVFVTEGSRDYPLFVKVLDFGVAKMLRDGDAAVGTGALTETGLVIGSAPYMSPEQLEGSKDVDRRSDLWSLGVIVYEALTGSRPFQGGSFVTVGAAVLKGHYRPAKELQPSLPEAIEDWFARTFSVDPAGRFQSAREMIDAFRTLSSGRIETPAPTGPFSPHSSASEPEPPPATEPHAPIAAPPSEPPRSPRRRRLAYAVLATFAAALLATAAVLTARSRPAASAGCPRGMTLIRGADFQMGSASSGDTPSDETSPNNLANAISVRTFCLDTTEVTSGAYAACASCGHPPMTAEFEGLTPNGRAFESQFCNAPEATDHPINCVDWHDAVAFCKSTGRRLPTEAEWELAARGPGSRTYPWGEALPSGDRLNACGPECSRMLTSRLEKLGKAGGGAWPSMYGDDDSSEATARVGRYAKGATPEGVLDLAGNVWEWTASFYCPYPYRDGADCGDSRRVLRGGGWDTTDSQSVRAAHRYPTAATARGKSIGFRCARSL